jgi:hypothetical protein
MAAEIKGLEAFNYRLKYIFEKPALMPKYYFLSPFTGPVHTELEAEKEVAFSDRDQ